MKPYKIFEALKKYSDIKADKDAGYPPNCNDGYIEKDGKCVPEKDTESDWNDKKKKEKKKKMDY
tara:strand:+ start:280 stop:471 length:192 start_codon:yes stop_codon:yes gene_type:complete